jgi:tripartite-type tricarboxylate transporter receptor subunit TctC
MSAVAWRLARVTVCGLSLLAAPALAQTYPARQVTLVVPFGPGSATDSTARVIAQNLQESLGQPFVIENKAGGGGLIAASAVARAAPDGYTLLVTTNTTHSAAPGLFKNVPYDPIKDFTPVARIGSFPTFIAVNADLPVRTIGELVAYAKQYPGKLVGYRSNPPAVTDLIGGHIGMMIPDFGLGLPQVKAQKIRALAVPTRERNSQLPDVPTLNETVIPGFDLLSWVGMFAPANTPPQVVELLARELQKMLARPELKARFMDAGAETFWSGPQEFDAYVRSELIKWTTVIKQAGIEPE